MNKVNIIIASVLLGIFIIGCGAAAITASRNSSQPDTSAADQANEISEQQAKDTAFQHAGVQESDVQSLTISRTNADGKQLYSISFHTADKEYAYDIDRTSGEIINSSFKTITAANVTDDTDDTTATGQAPDTNQSGASNSAGNTSTGANTNANASAGASTSSNSGSGSAASQKPAASAPKSGSSSSNTASSSANSSSNNTSSAITETQAKTIAFNHAGVAASDVKMVKVKSDWENGTAVFEVDFYAGNKEYNYDIAKSSGKIIKYDVDVDDDGYRASAGTNNNTSSNTNSNTSSNANSGANAGSANIISLEKARSLALAKVSGATVNDIRIELERDDGKMIYEGEIYYNNMEYEFEIDATTGNFIEWSID